MKTGYLMDYYHKHIWERTKDISTDLLIKNNLISIITLPVNITQENFCLKCISAFLKMWDIVYKTDSLGQILWPYFCVNKEAQKKTSTWDKFVKNSL